MNFISVPTYEQSVASKNGQISSVWYRFLQGSFLGTPPSAESAISMGSAPFTFTFPTRGFVILSGGTVSSVQFVRTVTTLTGQTSGIFPGSQGDQLIIIYTALPTMVFVPQ